MEKKNSSVGGDIIVMVILIELAGFMVVFFYDDAPLLLRIALAVNLLISPVAGLLGISRKIGFLPVYLISLVLSPLLGCIFAISSSKIEDEEYKEKMLQMTEKNSSASSVADQLYKLNELRKEGVITEREFMAQKQRLIDQ